MNNLTKTGYKIKPGRGRPKLPVDVNKTLNMYRVGQMTVREVAGIMGVSPNTIARRITDNNGQLRGWRLPGES
jgi:DNA-directed RNA polymerase specialized sigma24 family protein